MAANSMLKIWILVTRRVLRMDFSKLETLGRKRIQKIQFKTISSQSKKQIEEKVCVTMK